MQYSSSSELLGQDPDDQNLHNYLKDSTFIQYLNSFLILPAFHKKIFYNEDTGYFEPVNSSEVLIDGDQTPSSIATLYIPENINGPSFEKNQSWEWVIKNRLPLFIRSDLYSEYKICKRLTSSFFSTCKSPSSLLNSKGSSPQLQQKMLEEGTDDGDDDDDDLNLPEITNLQESVAGNLSTINIPETSSINLQGSIADDSTIDLASMKHSAIGVSKSNAELESRVIHKPRQRVTWHRSVSVSPNRLTSHRPIEKSPDFKSDSKKVMITAEDVQFLSTKSGMSALWKFLKGKAGERNWLFWLDAERVKYFSKSIEQQRLIRELVERYLHSGSPLELSTEAIIKLRMNKSTRIITLEEIEEIQEAAIVRLREYWCPCFLLHYFNKCDNDSFTMPYLPTTFRPRSTIPGLTHGHTSLTPTNTPTIRRIKKSHSVSLGSYHKPAQKGIGIRTSSRFHPQSQMSDFPNISENVFDVASTAVMNEATRTYDKSMALHSSEKSPISKAIESPMARAEGSPIGKCSTYNRNIASSAAWYSQLAKYTPHHLPDPNSRCASRLEGSDIDDSDSLCASRCRILSVSGTPLHSIPISPIIQTPTIDDGSTYRLLLQFLGSEYRKAGGYFMRYLEEQENEVYCNCLLFWREVQKYKELFIQQSFSPCAVEMKAKALFGRYICEGCSESIDCPSESKSNIFSNLWPPYEDLFDQAEEYALSLLSSKWIELCNSEDETFRKIDIETHFADFETDFEADTDTDTERLDKKVSRHSSSRGRWRSRWSYHSTYSRPSSILQNTKSYESSGHSTTSTSFGTTYSVDAATTLDEILRNPIEMEYFKLFLNENAAAEDLMCWMDIEAFRSIPAIEKAMRNYKAKQIRKKFLNKKYFFGPNSPASKEARRQTLCAGGRSYGSRLPARPSTPVLREAQKHVRSKLEKVWSIKFTKTPEFLSRNGGCSQLRKSRTNISILQSQTAMLEQSFINSHEAILLRKLLLSKDCAYFQQFLEIKCISGALVTSIKNPKTDIEFWVEVQRYKGMFHAHTTESTLQSKANAIIDCYFNSSVPPKIQVDVPSLLADQACQKPSGPYLFRETQAALFKKLHYCWREFVSFIKDLDNREIQKALYKLEEEAIIIQRLKKQQEERNRLEIERRKLSIPHFETKEERQLRQKYNRELEEFGQSAVTFRLSTPNPRYIYYTDLPETFYTESMFPVKKPRKSTLNIVDSDIGDLILASDVHQQKTPILLSKVDHRDSLRTEQTTCVMTDTSENESIPMMLEGYKKSDHQARQLSQTTTKPPRVEAKLRSSNSTYSTRTNIHQLSSTASNETTLSLTEQKLQQKNYLRNSITFSKYGTGIIKMQRSNRGKGEDYSYGNGLSEEHSSYLAITSQSII